MKEIRFFDDKGEHRILSNASQHPIILEGTSWRTAEHYFQAKKFLDDHLEYRIALAGTPAEAVAIASDLSSAMREDWELVKDTIVRRAIEAKVAQHSDVRETLVLTNTITLVYCSPDNYWGIGEQGEGKNRFGQLLMEVREALSIQVDVGSTAKSPPWVLYPDIGPYDMGWSMGKAESDLGQWVAWFHGLSEQERASYIKANLEPELWKGFYSSDRASQ